MFGRHRRVRVSGGSGNGRRTRKEGGGRFYSPSSPDFPFRRPVLRRKTSLRVHLLHRHRRRHCTCSLPVRLRQGTARSERPSLGRRTSTSRRRSHGRDKRYHRSGGRRSRLMRLGGWSECVGGSVRRGKRGGKDLFSALRQYISSAKKGSKERTHFSQSQSAPPSHSQSTPPSDSPLCSTH